MRRSGSGTVLIANPGADLYGSDRMALETVSVLIGSGYRVVVAVAGNGPLVELLVARGAQVRVCRTPIVRKSSMRPRGMLGLLNDVRRSVVPGVRLIREVDPDLVLVNTITSPLWFLLARLLRRPCVAHVHEGEATASGLVLRALNAPLLLTRALIINSEFSRSVVVKAIPRLSQRSVVVYNAVAAVDVAPPREQLTAPVRLLYVGRLSPRKGPQVAIDALALLRARGHDVELDLVGAVFPGYEWFEAQLRAQVAQAGLRDVVAFQGFQADVSRFVAAADLILVPSTVDEPFGNTAVEAVLASRPVVVSAVGGLPEAVAGFDSAKLVEPGNVDQLAAAAEQILAEWDVFRARAAADAEMARTRFSSESYGRGIEAVLAGIGVHPQSGAASITLR